LGQAAQINEAQEQIPKVTPLDATEEWKKIWTKQWLIGASIMIVTAIIAIAFGVVLGRSNDENDANTESPMFILLEDMVRSVWSHSSEVILDESSPQYSALKWLEGNTYLNEYPEWKRIQRYILAILYYSTNGDSWQQNDKWMSDEDECLWALDTSDETNYPVCNNKTESQSLILKANNLDGMIPLELGGLSNSLSKQH
jgi:hypothetical protein